MLETDTRRAQRSILAAFGLLAVFFSGVFPPFSNPNELSRFETVVAAVEHGTFAIDAVIPVLGDHEDKAASGGRLYSNKAPGLALAAIPVYRVLRAGLAPPVTANADPIFAACACSRSPSSASGPGAVRPEARGVDGRRCRAADPVRGRPRHALSLLRAVFLQPAGRRPCSFWPGTRLRARTRRRGRAAGALMAASDFSPDGRPSPVRSRPC
jgi:hypothetical protein